MKLKPYAKYKDSGIQWIGEIPAEWELSKVKHICSKSAEYGLNESSENYVDEGVRFLRITDINENNELIENGVYLPADNINKEYLLSTGDMLLARSGSIGTSLYYDEKKYGRCSFAGYLVRFIVDDSNNSKFLYYFTKSKSFYAQIELYAIQTTIENFNGQKYANMQIAVPPIQDQIAIASFLDSKTSKLNKTIEKDKQLIELLKEKRSALINQLLTKGLDPNEKMKDSGVEWVGKIPEGWELVKIKHLAGDCSIPVQTGPFGAQLHAEDYVNKGVPLILIRNVNHNRINTINIPFVSEYDAERLSMYKVKSGDIVFSRVGSLGRAALVTEKEGGWLISGQMLRLRLKHKRILTSYLICIFQSDLSEAYVSYESVGSTRESLNTEILSNMFIPIPSKQEQQKIVEYLEKATSKIDKTIQKIEEKINLLEEYKKSLIHYVVTGKVDVREVKI